MSYTFFGLAFVLAVVDWIAVARGWKKLEYFAKPATMVALLAFMVQNGGLKGGMLWFTLGLVFSLAGDVFLMLPRDRFIAGLVSFLLAHVAYIIGFKPRIPSETSVLLIALGLAAIVALVSTQVYRRIAAGLRAKGKQRLQAPVLLYTLVISVMLISAMLTLLSNRWYPLHAVAVCLGAALFYLSDTVLAWNRFVNPLRNGRLINMSTYHLGQLLIALGAALHYFR
jgi:uncharacterized membrane protein YhhN